MKSKYSWTIAGAIVTPIFATISIILLGGGHGTPVPLTIFYPIVWWNKDQTYWWIVILFQYVIYGYVIDSTKGKSYGNPVKLILLAIHVLCILIAFSINM